MARPSSDDGDFDDGHDSRYKAPEKKTLDEIQNLDPTDESLKRYKEMLLGKPSNHLEVPFPKNPSNVVIDKLCICIDNGPEIEVQLQGEDTLAKLKSTPVQMPEGVLYRIKVYYYVQRDIVSGLMYKQATYRGPVRVDKMSVMMGSYRPQLEPHIWTSDPEKAPKGAMSRGTYHIKSRFTDDDKNNFVSWDWAINVVKADES